MEEKTVIASRDWKLTKSWKKYCLVARKKLSRMILIRASYQINVPREHTDVNIKWQKMELIANINP